MAADKRFTVGVKKYGLHCLAYGSSVFPEQVYACLDLAMTLPQVQSPFRFYTYPP